MSSSQDRSLYDASNALTSHNEIRLLRIEHAADRGAELRCSLFPVSLNSNPKYFALSYMWGEDQITAPIMVNNISVRVSLNLDAALRYIRLEDEPTIFWIDALCINQADNKEKEKQLPIMGSIYSKAITVYVCTGHEDNDSQDTFELIRRWTANLDPRFYSMRSNDWDLYPKCKQWFKEQIWTNRDDLMEEKLYKSAIKFFKRPYWERVWVQQEMLLGRVTKIMAGNTYISFLQMFAFFYAEHHTARLHESGPHRRILTRPAVISACIALHHSDMAQLMEVLKFCDATKLHDKIYGFLGLQSRDDTKIVMDHLSYDQPAADVYAQFVLTMARSIKHGKLFVDGSNGIGFVPQMKRLCKSKFNAEGKIPGLPSWAPDFTVTDYLPVPKEREAPEPYGAAKNTMPLMNISNDWKILTSEGVVFDRVESLSVVGNLYCEDEIEAQAERDRLLGYILSKLKEEHPTGVLSLQACFRSIFPFRPETDPNLINHAIGFLASLGTYARTSLGNDFSWNSFTAEYASNLSEDRRHAFQLLVQKKGERHPLAEEALAMHEAALAFFADNNNYLPGLRNTTVASVGEFIKLMKRFRDALKILSWRTVFTTKKHYIGHGPLKMKYGDQVCVLLGCDRPLVIRPTKDPNMYEVVGPIMMYGVHDGEIIRQATAGTLEYQKLSFQ